MTAAGLDGANLVALIGLGIVCLIIVALCIGGLRDSESAHVLVMIAVVAVFIGVLVFTKTDVRVYSVSGTVTEVSDVLWDDTGKPFTEVKLDSIDHPVRMMGNAGVKELVGKEKTFTCTYKGQTTEDDPIYVCK